MKEKKSNIICIYNNNNNTIFKLKKKKNLYWGNGIFLNDAPNYFANRLFYKNFCYFSKNKKKGGKYYFEKFESLVYKFSKFKHKE